MEALLVQALRHMLKAEAWPLHRDALRALPDTMDAQPPLPVPPICPVTLDELLSDD